MRYLALIAVLLPVPALAGEDLLAKYRAESDLCYARAEYADDLVDCSGLIASACENQEPGGRDADGQAACMNAEAAFWSEKMDAEYQAAMALFIAADAAFASGRPGAPIRAERLEAAQQAWRAFRDAQCAMSYSISASAPLRPMWQAGCVLDMTHQRTQELAGLKQTITQAGVMH